MTPRFDPDAYVSARLKHWFITAAQAAWWFAIGACVGALL
jgi:hypothetical protein